MKCLERNRQKFYYANLIGRECLADEWGNETGEGVLIYSDPIPVKAHVSAATGNTESTLFGLNLDYDRVIFVENDDSVDLDEQSILWVDRLPTQSHDYIVKRVAKSLNFMAVALRKVDVVD